MNLMKYHKLEENPAKIIESVQVKPKLDKVIESTLLTEGFNDNNLPSYLLPKIEAIHAGTTRNFNNYPAVKLQGNSDLKSGVYSFVSPYPKPVIYNHDVETKATGRIESAAYSDVTEAGRPGIITIPRITDKEAIKSILDKRLLTVSIGATTDAALCNICGCDIINEGYCGHMKGEEYDGKTCEWITGNLWFDELSWVNVPADSDAMVVDSQAILTIGENNTSKNCSTTEKFGVPKESKLIVVEYNKNNNKEENSKMDEKEILEMKERLNNLEKENKDLSEKLAEKNNETEVPENKESNTDSKEPEVVIDETTEADTKSEPETKEDTPVVKEEPEVIEDTTTENKKLENDILVEKNLNKSLLTENEYLQKELKDVYINNIVEHKGLKDEEKTNFIEKIQNRSLDSLKDMLTDMQESLDNRVVENTTRQIVKVNNPIVESKQTEEPEVTIITESEKVNILSGLFNVKK